jgi:glycosyltransferase involved in cell wall biosynthesis
LTVVKSVDSHNIAFLVPALLIGGAERQLFQLAKILKAQGKRVTIVTFAESDVKFHEATSDANVKVLRVPKGRNTLAFVRRLRAALERERIEILHAYLTTAQAYSVLVRCAGWNGTLVFGIRDALPFFYHKTVKSILSEIVAFNPILPADSYVFNSHAGLKQKEKFLRRGRSIVIPNFVDTDRFRPSRDRSALRSLIAATNNATVVGMVANATRYKDYPTFIAAASSVLKKCPEVRFVAVGSLAGDYGQEAADLVRRNGISDRFLFLGLRPDVDRLLPGMDNLCSSSVTEGSSNVIAEAMACGVPCVVTDVGDSPRLVGNCGRVVQARNPANLANAILSLIYAGQAERARLGLGCRARAVATLSAQSVVASYLAFYERLIDGREKSQKKL